VVFAQAGEVTLKPVDDTYVDSYDSNSNYGGQTHLDIQTYEWQRIAWLKFNLSSIPDGAVIGTAALQLYTNVVGETYNVSAYSCSDNSWVELTLTYSDMPSYNTTSMSSVVVASASQRYNWSVVDGVNNALSNNRKSTTIVLREETYHASSTNQVVFDSKEASLYFNNDYSPKLTVHWSDVVPEFSLFLTPALFIMVTLLGVVWKRKIEKLSRATCAS
jgi:hypothetical protein